MACQIRSAGFRSDPTRSASRLTGSDTAKCPSREPADPLETDRRRATRTEGSGAAALLQILRSDQDLAGLGALARADDPVLLHHVDEAGGLRVAQAHPPLQKGNRRRPLADHEPYAVPVELVALRAVPAVAARAAVHR